MKVFELAKQLEVKALDLIDKVKPLGLSIKNHMSDLPDDDVEKIKEFLSQKASASSGAKKKKKKTVRKKKAAVKKKKAVVITRARKPKEEEPAAPEASTEEAPAVEAATPQTSDAQETPTAVVAEAAEAVSSEEAPKESTKKAAASEKEAKPAQEAAPEKKKEKDSRYSVIRIASREELSQPRKPLIVTEAEGDDDAVPTKKKPSKGSSGIRTAEDILREIQQEEAQKKKGTSAKPQVDSNFKSTDYLRRERVYHNRKKRLNISRGSSKVSTVEMGSKKKVVEFNKTVTVDELADQLRVKSREVLRKLRDLGVERPEAVHWRDDWFLDMDTAQIVTTEFGYEFRDVTRYEDKILESNQDQSKDFQPRAPVITIMGHVDHGKTSILDLIRKSRVVSGEAGGITQHIGAYSVDVDTAVENLRLSQLSKAEQKKAKKKAEKAPKAKAKKKDVTRTLTFLDTPGHAAFSAMRSRGASVTDIVILVVSAADGVMPQTREAVEHSRAAGVPMIVAVNKIDLAEANPDKVKQQLGELEVVPEDWGGDTQFIHVSAMTGEGMDKLLEAVQLQAEILELKAAVDGSATGSVIEAHLDKGKGPLATVLIQKGTIEVGQFLVVGNASGKCRAIVDDQGKNVKSAGPSDPVAILGLDIVPAAGDQLHVVDNERAAKEVIDLRERKDIEAKAGGKMTLEDLFAKMNEGEVLELPLIIKADVRGSAEAIEGSLEKLPKEKVKLKVLSSAVGGITESDVLLASASNAIVVGFNVRPDTKSKNEAENRGVQIKTYDVIYNLIDDVRAAMEGLLAPETKENELGRAEVRNVFNLSRSGVVAGCFVEDGKILRNAHARLVRDGRVVYTGKIQGLKRFKDDAKEVAKGYECGITLEDFNDIKNGDFIEAFEVQEFAASLEGAAKGASENQPSA